jgi:HSP20 family protein
MSLFLSVKKSASPDDDLLLFPEATVPVVPGEAAAPWLQFDEGQLAVDVFDAPSDLLIRAAIAGVKPEHLEVFLDGDMLTIRGERRVVPLTGRPVVQECHWGKFARTIIVPTEIDAENIRATIKEGVLTVVLPKIARTKRIEIYSR